MDNSTFPPQLWRQKRKRKLEAEAVEAAKNSPLLDTGYGSHRIVAKEEIICVISCVVSRMDWTQGHTAHNYQATVGTAAARNPADNKTDQ